MKLGYSHLSPSVIPYPEQPGLLRMADAVAIVFFFTIHFPSEVRFILSDRLFRFFYRGAFPSVWRPRATFQGIELRRTGTLIMSEHHHHYHHQPGTVYSLGYRNLFSRPSDGQKLDRKRYTGGVSRQSRRVHGETATGSAIYRHRDNFRTASIRNRHNP